MLLATPGCSYYQCKYQRDHQNIYRIISYFIDTRGFFDFTYLIEVNHEKPDKEGKNCCRPVIDQKSKKQFRIVCIMLECFKDICRCPFINKSVINKIHTVHCYGDTICNEKDVLQYYLINIFVADFQRNNM